MGAPVGLRRRGRLSEFHRAFEKPKDFIFPDHQRKGGNCRARIQPDWTEPVIHLEFFLGRHTHGALHFCRGFYSEGCTHGVPRGSQEPDLRFQVDLESRFGEIAKVGKCDKFDTREKCNSYSVSNGGIESKDGGGGRLRDGSSSDGAEVDAGFASFC